jgi:AraC-like DNA-binding protein/mannose-6-phosphate isomerase-like protein (cupin superfamily)
MRDRIDPDDHDGVARPVLAIGNDYPPSFELETHRHRRGQVLYAASGVVAVSTPQGAWVAPPERAVWIPGGTPHAVRMVGAVSTRSVMIEPGVASALGTACRVVEVSPLLRNLLAAATQLPIEYDLHGRDQLVIELLLTELERAPVIPIAVPFPTTDVLASKCHAFLETPTPHDTIAQWARELRLSRRSFTRRFRIETGMSFAEWRQQACLLIALPRLAGGESVTAVALDMGYDSPAAFATMFKRRLGFPPSHYQT